MLQDIIKVSPKNLFPTQTLASIESNTLQFYRAMFENDLEVEYPKVFFFEGNYYIMDGHHRVLAAVMLHKEEIIVEVQDYKECPSWCDEKYLKETLKSIGMSTLYDFEAIGDFRYLSYPEYYKE